MRFRPAKLLLIAFLTIPGPGAARASDLDKASDMLALAYLSDRLLDRCSFSGDGRGNAIRVTADYYRERIEGFVLDPLGRKDAETVKRAARTKAEAMFTRLVHEATEHAGRRQARAMAAWCAGKGEAVVEAVARVFRASEQEARRNLVAAAEE